MAGRRGVRCTVVVPDNLAGEQAAGDCGARRRDRGGALRRLVAGHRDPRTPGAERAFPPPGGGAEVMAGNEASGWRFSRTSRTWTRSSFRSAAAGSGCGIASALRQRGSPRGGAPGGGLHLRQSGCGGGARESDVDRHRAELRGRHLGQHGARTDVAVRARTARRAARGHPRSGGGGGPAARHERADRGRGRRRLPGGRGAHRRWRGGRAGGAGRRRSCAWFRAATSKPAFSPGSSPGRTPASGPMTGGGVRSAPRPEGRVRRRRLRRGAAGPFAGCRRCGSTRRPPPSRAASARRTSARSRPPPAP